MKVPSFKPKCPNHGVDLVDLPFPLPSKGVGVCPISHCQFEFEIAIDEEEVVMNKDGTTDKKMKWKTEGEEA